MAGIYLHIPFCASRCIYCGFYSTTDTGWRGRYVDALGREMQLRQEEFARLGSFSTVYYGGGTPSQLTPEHLAMLFNQLEKMLEKANGTVSWNQLEVTLEANPDDLTAGYTEALGRLPFNRVSMGVQTFDDQRLRFLHRRHRSWQVMEAIHCLRAAGISNISIDLMFGFPGQTLQEWATDIDKAIDLKVEHISAYSLTYETGTALQQMLDRGEVEPVNEELSRSMYEMLIDRLTNAGFEHYEISNFGKVRSRHNSSYWQQQPYIGLGAAAHSYDGTHRSWNIADLRQYVGAMERGERLCEEEEIDRTTRFNDLIVTALRTADGLKFSWLSAAECDYLLRQAQPMVERRLLERTADGIRLTREGLFISDDIMTRLIRIDD